MKKNILKDMKNKKEWRKRSEWFYQLVEFVKLRVAKDWVNPRRREEKKNEIWSEMNETDTRRASCVVVFG